MTREIIGSVNAHGSYNRIEDRVLIYISFTTEDGKKVSEGKILTKKDAVEIAKEQGATPEQVKELKRILKGISLNRNLWVRGRR